MNHADSPQSPLASSMERLRKEFDQWLETAMSQGGRALGMFGLRPGSGGWCPALDVVEGADDVQVTVDLPGIDPQSVDVSLAGNMLTISGTKPATVSAEGQTTHLGERPSGKFSRSIPMPAAVDPEKVTAEARDGTLHITLAKNERSKARQIPVNVDKP